MKYRARITLAIPAVIVAIALSCPTVKLLRPEEHCPDRRCRMHDGRRRREDPRARRSTARAKVSPSLPGIRT